jgi:hypothetical protein
MCFKDNFLKNFKERLLKNYGWKKNKLERSYIISEIINSFIMITICDLNEFY